MSANPIEMGIFMVYNYFQKKENSSGQKEYMHIDKCSVYADLEASVA